MGVSILKTDNYDVYVDNVPATDSAIYAGQWGGKVRVQIGGVDVSEIEAGSTIFIAKIPEKSTLLWGKIFIEANGANVTMAVGDGTTADKYLAAANASAAGILAFPLLIGTANLRVTVDTDIVITTAGATIAASKAIKTQIAYLLE